MADALIMRIGKLRSVEIIPLSSVKRYGGVDQDPIAAGIALGVQSVLDGWVQRSGERLRVSVRLLDVGNGQQLWADRFDEKLTDIFTLQDVIAERVADSVLKTVTGGERQQLRHHATENAEAFQLYVTGWWALTRPGGGNLEQALRYFEQAVALDTNFALAHVCVADCYALLGVFALRAPHEVFPQARLSVLRALAIDAELAEAHAELGHIHSMYDLDWQNAELACRRALEINPRSSMAHHYLGLNMIFRGELDAALVSIKRAQSIEPLAANYNANIGMIHYYARRYEEAMAQLEATLRIDDGFDHARSFLGRVFLRLGEFNRAIDEFKRRSNVTIGSAADLPVAHALSGQVKKATRELNELLQSARTRYVSAYDVASIYAALENVPLALEWLERAIDQRAAPIIFLALDPAFENFHGEQRFQRILHRLALR